jgi:hypothetical protein
MDALGFLNYNMTQAGCVSDLICANDRARVAHSRLERPTERELVVAEQLSETTAKLSEAYRELSKTSAALLDTTTTLYDVTVVLRERTRTLEGTSVAHAAERSRADEFEHSLSWKVTAPLRRMRKFLSR